MSGQPIPPMPALKLGQYDTSIYLTKFKASLLVQLFRERYLSVDRYQGGEEDSYQRLEDKKRVRELSDFLINYRGDDLVKPILPSTIVLNVRDPRDIDFENGNLTIKKSAKLNIVDGQHRARALLDAETRGDPLDYEIPVSIVTNLARFQEAAQFLVINVKQKQVRTDLTLTVLYELERRNTADFVERLKKALRIDAWQLMATTMAISLNNDRDSPWYDMIIRPNEERSQLKEMGRLWTPIRQASLVDSLRRFAERDQPDIKSKIDFLKKYWRHIKNKYPQPFDVDVGKNYVLLKGAGVGPIHAMATLVYSLDKEQIIGLEDSIAKLHEKFDAPFWERRGEGAGRWGTSQAEFAKNARQLAKGLVPQLYDLFDEAKLTDYVGRGILNEDDKLVELATHLFDPFSLEPIEFRERDPRIGGTVGCYLLVSGTASRIRAYVGQSHSVGERIADHSRPVKLYSYVEVEHEDLNEMEALCYHLTKASVRLNDNHPPLDPCRFCNANGQRADA